jgi:hypothetical protein
MYGLLLMQLRHHHNPLRWLVIAAFRGLVQGESLKRTTNREEQNCWCDKNSEVQVDLTDEF